MAATSRLIGPAPGARPLQAVARARLDTLSGLPPAKETGSQGTGLTSSLPLATALQHAAEAAGSIGPLASAAHSGAEPGPGSDPSLSPGAPSLSPGAPSLSLGAGPLSLGTGPLTLGAGPASRDPSWRSLQAYPATPVPRPRAAGASAQPLAWATPGLAVLARSAQPGSSLGQPVVPVPPWGPGGPEATGVWPAPAAATSLPTVARFEEDGAQAPSVQTWTLPGWLSSILPQAPAPVAEQAKDLVAEAGHAERTGASKAPGEATQDLDDLAQKLYPKLRPYLKKELWLDRERAGMLTR